MRRHNLRWIGALVVVAALLTSCSDDDDSADTQDTTATTEAADATTTAPAEETTTSVAGTPVEAQTLDLTAVDFSYDSGGVTELEAGVVTVTLTNEGEQEHQATFARFKEGKSLEDLIAMGDDGSQLGQTLDVFGGPNAAAPGGSSVTSTIRLTEPGDYVVMCFIPDQTDGQPHAAKGQILPLTVTAPAEPTDGEIALPDAPETVALDDFQFVVPDGFTGAGSVLVENQGEQFHELVAYKAADGATGDDVAAFLTADPADGPPAGPPPIAGSTGVTPMNPGEANVVELDLTPGEWVFICFIPDVESGAPHFTKGMVQTVTVS